MSIFIDMDTNELKLIIKQVITEELFRENLTNLDDLHDNVSSSTMIGSQWFKLVSSLASVIDEINEFPSMYSAGLHGPLPNTSDGLRKLQQIAQLLSEIKPLILSIDNIEKRDV